MLTQSFGDIGEDIANEADTVTAVEFDEEGQTLATGDRGGRIVVFKQAGTQKKSQFGRRNHSSQVETPIWTPFFQFQSHDIEFDYLKSLEIEEKINQIRFCKRICGKLFILSTNDKTIKLWKVADRPQYYSEAAASIGHGKITSPSQLPLPRMVKSSLNDLGIANSTVAIPRKVFDHAHSYHINSLSLNSDGETFLSSDDLTVNTWNLERSDVSFNIIDIKPTQMEELAEVITCAHFHPFHCSILAHSSSKGILSICDLRQAAIIDRGGLSSSPTAGKQRKGGGSNVAYPSVRTFYPPDDPVNTNFGDILSSTSDFKFTKDGRYIVSRDYLTVKIWDVNMEARPVLTIPVHDHLKPVLPTLYESESLFDKFEILISSNNQKIITGSYNNYYYVFAMDGSREMNIQLPTKQSPSSDHGRAAAAAQEVRSPSEVAGTNGFNGIINGMKTMKINGKKGTVPAMRPDQKVLHGAWHPNSNVVAIAGQTGLFMYGMNA